MASHSHKEVSLPTGVNLRTEAFLARVTSLTLHQHLGFTRGLTIVSLNVSSLRNHHDEIQLLLRDHDIHMIAINETKLDSSYSTELPRTNSFEHERKDKTCNGRGVT